MRSKVTWYLQARARRARARHKDPDAARRRSLAWDQGPEMRDWKQVRVDAGIEVFFCDPNALW